jgi:arginine/glutamate-rich protein 1
VLLSCQEEKKRHDVELQRIVEENNRKLLEAQKRQDEERLRMIQEKQKEEEAERKQKETEDKQQKEIQDAILNRRGKHRPKLSFVFNPL